MQVKALDVSGYINFDAAAAAGYNAIGGYLTGNFLGQPVAQQAAALGMGLFSFFEIQPTNPLGGTPAGIADGHTAVRYAQRVGMPSEAAIIVANDEAISGTWEWTETINYFAGFASVVRPSPYSLGLYGQTVLFQAITQYGYRYFYHAPDGTEPPPWANVICDVPPNIEGPGGMLIDIDIVQTPADSGMWNAQGTWPLRPKQGDTMIISVPRGLVLKVQPTWVLNGLTYWAEEATTLGGVVMTVWHGYDATDAASIIAANYLVVHDPDGGLFNRHAKVYPA